MSFVPSVYQAAVWDWFANPTSRGLVVNAVAGSGKTTTIVEGMNKIPRGASVLMLAFNKSIQQELEKKVPTGAVVKTFHSVGYAAWRGHVGWKRRIQVKGDKMRWLIRDMFERIDGERYGLEYDRYAALVRKMVPFGKNAGLGTYLSEADADAWDELAWHFGVDLPEEVDGFSLDQAWEYCTKALEDSFAQCDKVVDFDDMLYAPMRARATFKRFDYVFIDEAQDTNDLQIELLDRMLKRDGHIVAVGDRKQAIYGFRGADARAMDKIREYFDGVDMPLSICYRCPSKVVELAATIVPQIEAWEHAAEGTVETLGSYKAESFTGTDAILCANNAPLVRMAYGFIGRGVGVNFLGRDIGKGLADLVRKQEACDLDELQVKLSDWRDKQCARLNERGREDQCAAITDKCECIFTIVEHLSSSRQSINGLLAEIEDLFSDKGEGVLVLSTVHKSKGKEWDRVFILEPSIMPRKWAKRDWQQEQEMNLIYVAYTRAKRDLAFINLGGFED